MEYLRGLGYEVDITERYNHHSRQKNDLFGFADLIAIRPGVTLAVQTTTSSNMAARVKTVMSCKLAGLCKEAGWNIEVHGWALKGPQGKRKTWQVRIEEI